MSSGAASALPAAAQAVLSLLAAARRPLIIFHEHPDGDAIGSALALAHGLKARGGEPCIACSDPIGAYYRFLPGSAAIVGADAVRASSASFDLAVLVDCADMARTGALRELAEACPRLVNIDHHPTNDAFGAAAWVNPGAAASGELVAALLDGLGVDLSADMATCIYTAILTDTGSFRYNNTSPTCLELAARMIRVGARPELISDAVYEQRPRGDVELLAAGLCTLTLSRDGRIAHMSLTCAEVEQSRGDSEGIVNYGRMIAGVEAALLFREERDGTVKVSLRSRRIDVAQVAQTFGGGGHPRAAGLTYRGTLAAAREAVLAEVATAITAERSGGE